MKEQIIELAREAYDEVQAFVAGLDEEQRIAQGTLEHWSAKDAVAHMTEWIARVAMELKGEATPPEPGVEDIDRANAAIYNAYRDQSWKEVMDRLDASLREIARQVQAMSEDELRGTQRLPRSNQRPAWRTIVGTLYTHTLLHLSYIYIERGDRQKALRLNEDMAERLSLLDDSPSWRGTNLYNLACNYALTGEKEKALANLSEALRLAPELVEWSRQDADLVSLHDDPAYQALYPAG